MDKVKVRILETIGSGKAWAEPLGWEPMMPEIFAEGEFFVEDGAVIAENGVDSDGYVEEILLAGVVIEAKDYTEGDEVTVPLSKLSWLPTEDGPKKLDGAPVLVDEDTVEEMEEVELAFEDLVSLAMSVAELRPLLDDCDIKDVKNEAAAEVIDTVRGLVDLAEAILSGDDGEECDCGCDCHGECECSDDEE